MPVANGRCRKSFWYSQASIIQAPLSIRQIIILRKVDVCTLIKHLCLVSLVVMRYSNKTVITKCININEAVIGLITNIPTV